MRNNFLLPLYDVCLFEFLIPLFSENVTIPKNKAVNRQDKLSRRYRDRDLAKFESSRRYRQR
jgi:hypothetical protein